jgi:hypothetical protein
MKKIRRIFLLMLVAANGLYCMGHFESKVYAYAEYGCKTEASLCAGGLGVCGWDTGATGNIYSDCSTDGGNFGTYACQGQD